MRGKLKITETEDHIRVDAPAPQRPGRIVLFAVLAALGARLGWAPIWKFLNDTGSMGNVGPVSTFLAVPGFFLAAFGLFGLYAELSTSTVTFERSTIGFERRLAGLRTSRRWISGNDVQKLTTVLYPHAAAPGYLFLKLRRDRPVVLLRFIQPAQIDRVCTLLTQRGWHYGDPPLETGAIVREHGVAEGE
jgi:hypothetical protein